MRTIDDEVASKKAELEALRSIARESSDALAEWYDIELTYTSNAIEGNTLTRSETAIVLEKGITIGGKPLRDHLEALGHKDALEYVHALAERDEPLREMDVRRIHQLIVGRNDPEQAGRYSQHQRMISGSLVMLPPASEIGPLMGDFGRWLFEAAPSAEAAFAAHEKLVTIHPFSDGNGRTGRLLMNLLLLRAGYPPVVIAPENRLDYITSLETAQLRGDFGPYRRFMTARLLASLDHHLSILRR